MKYPTYKVTFQVRVDGICQNKTYSLINNVAAAPRYAVKTVYGHFRNYSFFRENPYPGARPVAQLMPDIHKIFQDYPNAKTIEVANIQNVEVI